MLRLNPVPRKKRNRKHLFGHPLLSRKRPSHRRLRNAVSVNRKGIKKMSGKNAPAAGLQRAGRVLWSAQAGGQRREGKVLKKGQTAELLQEGAIPMSAQAGGLCRERKGLKRGQTAELLREGAIPTSVQAGGLRGERKGLKKGQTGSHPPAGSHFRSGQTALFRIKMSAHPELKAVFQAETMNSRSVRKPANASQNRGRLLRQERLPNLPNPSSWMSRCA